MCIATITAYKAGMISISKRDKTHPKVDKIWITNHKDRCCLDMEDYVREWLDKWEVDWDEAWLSPTGGYWQTCIGCTIRKDKYRGYWNLNKCE